jgi:drug/metabolite transporter (DMT)-like permease
MTRGQFAVLGVALGAIVAGVFIIAFESNVALGGGTDIKQSARGIIMLVGAGIGFVLFALVGRPSARKGGNPTAE